MNKKLYLISGFLGSGKTTLMKQLFRLFSNRKIAVIVNEFGDQGVDGTLLAEAGVQVDEISNGSVFCVCRSDLFADILVKATRSDAEIVLVETSGLSDPTGMNLILNVVTGQSGQTFDFCGVIVLVDCRRFLKLYQNVVAIKQQIQSAGLILINKIDITDDDAVKETTAIIRDINPVANIYKTTFSEIKEEWLDELAAAHQMMDGGITRNTLGIGKLLVRVDADIDFEKLKMWIETVSKELYRLKGFVKCSSGTYLTDCVGDSIEIRPSDICTDSYLVLLFAGSDRLKKVIAGAWYDIFGFEISFA